LLFLFSNFYEISGLGFSFSVCRQVKLKIAPRTIERFKSKIRELTKRNHGISMKERLKRLNVYLVGWSGYFGIIQTKSVLEELDQWTRRRLRACMLKQWKLCKTKMENLKALGVSEKSAAMVAYSRKKSWRLANAPPVRHALRNTYWDKRGLTSLVDRYHELIAS
jgi:hypothetical protein